ncbi:unnamed protein product [Nesidiocoris tenuis]|uniref:Uncharacterized protein n=1 Tax=Nesidiocoris tenuis TaxID=355587 RepID=A0A6H5GWZ3_9HEMI|nr:unnamed protein product [Nesidiocoris tenuis]
MFSHPRPPQNRSETTTSTNYVRRQCTDVFQAEDWHHRFGGATCHLPPPVNFLRLVTRDDRRTRSDAFPCNNTLHKQSLLTLHSTLTSLSMFEQIHQASGWDNPVSEISHQPDNHFFLVLSSLFSFNAEEKINPMFLYQLGRRDPSKHEHPRPSGKDFDDWDSGPKGIVISAQDFLVKN